MEKLKRICNFKNISVENILCVFILMCPILDIVSFVYRNTFNINFSPSTIMRPIIPIIISIYLFLKKDKKFKLYAIGIGLIYLIYGVLHLIIYKTTLTGSSYSTVTHEAQYIVNYSFMILNLFLYVYTFKDNKNIDKLSKSVLISSTIYIISIYISIITKTSSTTYIEGMGYKGWFESGNSIGAILILSLFIIMNYIKDKKYRKIVIPVIVLEAIFLTTLLGTRVGLIGFVIVILAYVFSETVVNLIRKRKINKKIIAGGIAVVATVVLIIITVGSTTLQRRKHLEDIEKDIVDTFNNQEAHITGSLLEIKEKIDNNTLEDGYMNEAQKKSIVELYNIANDWNISNNDQRMQQLIYNTVLVKNQHNPVYILLGNGYLSNFRELVLEMEIPAFLFNFGVFGFLLYFIPFLSIWIYGVYEGIKNIRIIDSIYLMLLIGCGFVFALSFFAGYTFFNSSNMMIIIVLNTLLINKINSYKRRTYEKKAFIWNNRINNSEEQKEY